MSNVEIISRNEFIYDKWRYSKIILTNKLYGINNADLKIKINKINTLIVIGNKTFNIEQNNHKYIGAGSIILINLETEEYKHLKPINIKNLGLFGNVFDITENGNSLYITGIDRVHNKNINTIYKYDTDTLENITTITENDLIEKDNYGCSIAISKNNKYLFISANNVLNNNKSIGCIYVYNVQFDRINKIQIIIPVDSNIVNFGNKIKLSDDGNKLFITARYTTKKNKNKTTNVIFCYDNKNGIWEYHSEIMIGLLYHIDSFGYSLDCNYSGNMLVVGTPKGPRRRLKDITYGSGWVSVYSLIGKTWAEQPILPIPSEIHYRFGNSVNITDDYRRVLITGLNKNNINGMFYLYEIIEGEYRLFPLFDYNDSNIKLGNSSILSSDGRVIISNITNGKDYRENVLQLNLLEEI